MKAQTVTPKASRFTPIPKTPRVPCRIAAVRTGEITARLFNGGPLDSQVSDMQYFMLTTGTPLRGSTQEERAPLSPSSTTNSPLIHSLIESSPVIESQHKLVYPSPVQRVNTPPPSHPAPMLLTQQPVHEELSIEEEEFIHFLRRIHGQDSRDFMKIIREAQEAEQRALHEVHSLESKNYKLLQILQANKIVIPKFL
ncbi:hypothetical protein M413DRAFT_31881 [Hebeloma cylindrosporum]|uniref:Uncharacterized protein n=1 Tax=Hebeloma cylindrosporum TaxID=76867 RepID=A0A0C2Y516_HEBCY|nr:hypothetical protein M413DRAFT_31881 [Hebeloma cylindrosporum h7]